MVKSVRAFAPSSVGNVIVGFDILGFSFPVLGDEVEVTKDIASKAITIEEVSGKLTSLPSDTDKNTATRALQAMQTTLGLDYGFKIKIKKGIALGSGMGGSAASSVAAVVAANELLDQPLAKEKLLPFAIEGEVAASGGRHADNVAPSLLGGLCLVANDKVIKIPSPQGIYCVLVHPHLEIKTSEARGLLKKDVTLKNYVDQSANLAGFIAGCFQNDLSLIRASMKDLIIEPQRKILIPSFDELKSQAENQGAIGFSISGAGPSVFAWTETRDQAENLQINLLKIFNLQGISCDSWVAPLSHEGAKVLL